MRLRFGIIGTALLVVALTATGLAVAGGDGEEASDLATDLATQHESFVGLTLADATALAESEDRPWRIRRQDATEFALTADLWPGRVTFDVVDGIVTGAEIEVPNAGSPDVPAVEDPARAELIASGLVRLLTVDGSIHGADEIRVARTLGSGGTSLAPLDLELIASALEQLGTVRFIDDASAETKRLFAESSTAVVVVAAERLDVLDDRAELELSLWCGPLCGVYLTYEAIPSDGGWQITGPMGPIAVS